ncbi:pyochelin biosynthetic protein PchC [Kitasatospora sp. MAP12-15]|uniref:thioesterase II family protein n=1 Tax=unclassified Kitasatospora TaxID=2633591 RepID=UPI002476892F|nr:alpha/beta fold hydrolase [Kitasatospora sp. MAP12-44]MDH6113713.1 pyochelin biosynthetic protein PchC [Kitasatospora sp. MAP12-44]
MSTAGTWFHRYDAPADPGLRLVCFPHAGGSPSFYRSWQRRLPAGVELLAVCYPGRQDRIGEPAITAMSELADRLTRALLPRLDRPFAFFGHSMGSAVAYECALRLAREHGLRPTRLFASGRGAPHRVEPSAVPLAEADTETLLGALARLGSSTVGLLSEEAVRELLLPPLRADFRLIESYRPSAPERIGCPVVVYSGEQDRGCTSELVRAWSELTMARAEFHTFAGGHFYLEQAEDALLRHLGSHLADDLRLRRVARPAPR